jgi:hypothetical protein
MKRTPFKRKPSNWGKKGSRLRVKGKSDTSQDKDEIQALLRQIVIKKYGGCILREERNCGGELDAEGVVLQADHLITRANSATYADPRLVVCVCKRCHGWKHWHEAEYNELIKTILPESIVSLWDRCEQERRSHRTGQKQDWKVHILALKQELEKLNNPPR